MSTLSFNYPRRFIWRLTRAVFVVLAILSIAVGINVVGISIFGDVNGWSRWLDIHSGHFLIWRLCLYGATDYGWRWMRGRVLGREGTVEARRRLRRAEIAAVLAILVFEATVLIQSQQ